MQEGKLEDSGKPTEASLDWEPNAHKRRDRESNPGVIDAKRGKILYARAFQPEDRGPHVAREAICAAHEVKCFHCTFSKFMK